MHNKIHIILAACCTMLFMVITSCKEEKDEQTNYNNWEARNTEYFNQKFKQAQDSIAAGSKNWRLIKSVYKDAASSAQTDYIVVRVINCPHDDDTQKAIMTDSVYIHYRGKLIPRDAYVQDTTTYAKDGVMFDTSYYGPELNIMTAVPVKFAVKDLVDGFQTALMNMHEGDRFEVVVPQTLGYGSSSSNSSIPAYSTLRFDIMLTYIGRPGKKMPKVQ